MTTRSSTGSWPSPRRIGSCSSSGQNNDNEVHDGRTACTHTICQFLSLAWNGTIPTLNEVNRRAGMKPNVRNAMNMERGMVQAELETFLKNSKIPMKVVRGLPFKALLEASKNGPVFYGMRYGSAPPKTPTHKNGTTQKGSKTSPTCATRWSCSASESFRP